MSLPLSKRIKSFRLCYLSATLLTLLFTLLLIALSIQRGIEEGLRFKDAVRLFALTALLLFQGGIVSFIIRSLRCGQTLLMKHLVFKGDGSPYPFGIALAASVCLATLCLAILLFSSLLLPAMELFSRLFVGGCLLSVGMQLLFVCLYFVCFRYEAGSFTII